MGAMEFYIRIRASIDLSIEKTAHNEEGFEELFLKKPHEALDKYLQLKIPKEVPIEVIEQKPGVLQIVYPKKFAPKIVDVYIGAAMQRCGKKCVDNLEQINEGNVS